MNRYLSTYDPRKPSLAIAFSACHYIQLWNIPKKQINYLTGELHQCVKDFALNMSNQEVSEMVYNLIIKEMEKDVNFKWANSKEPSSETFVFTEQEFMDGAVQWLTKINYDRGTMLVNKDPERALRIFLSDEIDKIEKRLIKRNYSRHQCIDIGVSMLNQKLKTISQIKKPTVKFF